MAVACLKLQCTPRKQMNSLKGKQNESGEPPFLHLEEQPTSLIGLIMPRVQPDHHVVYIRPSTIVLLILHPAENSSTMLQQTSPRHLLHHPHKKSFNIFHSHPNTPK